MNIHILGICGTFMGGVALLAKESGVTVSGSDENVYPPMSTLLEDQGIDVQKGFKVSHLNEFDSDKENQVVVGNVMTRGKDVVEYTLNQNLSYTSGPQWLYENILKDKWVLAVSGTHGKTTTASILAWILDYAGLNPGFLIGGVPENFGVSARLGESPFFVVEADEYDTAFFDKRSKFVHYHPTTLVINNLEFDHADIFTDLDAIKTQFHHLIRMVPSKGLIVLNGEEQNINDVIDKGCWTPKEAFSSENVENTEHQQAAWSVQYLQADGSEFELRANIGKQKIIAILEPRSNTMKLGVHKETLAASLTEADQVILFQPKELDWKIDDFFETLANKSKSYDDIDDIVLAVSKIAKSGDHVLIMSNGGFGGIHEKLLHALENKNH